MKQPAQLSTPATGEERRPKLFIGPWVGEFGIEILRWQGLCRAIVASGSWSEVIVAASPESFFLYEDFADRFVSWTPRSADTVGFKNLRDSVPHELHESYVDLEAGDKWLSPAAFTSGLHRCALPAAMSKFRDFSLGAPPANETFDLLIHARATEKAKQRHKNWSLSNWDAIVEALGGRFRIASIGARTGAHKLHGTEDRRGIPLANLAALCSESKLMIGPSSGPIHFALHCGTPVVTWMGGSFENYGRTWNPLEVPLIRLQKAHPHPELVLAKIRNLVQILESRKAPVSAAVFATKRSGHHALIEWLAAGWSQHRHWHWNDCIRDSLVTAPIVSFALPLSASYPKTMNELSTVPCVYRYPGGSGKGKRILSFEGVPAERLEEISEIAEAERVIFVLRDAANCVASLKKGMASIRNRPFSQPALSEMLRVYDSYLKEAPGATNRLGGMKKKAYFVSYNRWHSDPEYRKSLADELELSFDEAESARGLVSRYGPGSSFQKPGTASGNLNTLERWRHFRENNEFWSLVVTPDRFAMEQLVHGDLPYLNGIELLSK